MSYFQRGRGKGGRRYEQRSAWWTPPTPHVRPPRSRGRGQNRPDVQWDAEPESESSYYGSWSRMKQDDWSNYAYALWIDDAGVFRTVVKHEVYNDGDLGPMVKIGFPGYRQTWWVSLMPVMAYEQSLDGQMACGPGDDDDLSDLSMGDMSDFEADDQHDAHGSHGGRWSLPSQGTSRLTKSSGKDVQVFERRFRSGVPPRVPTYDGNRDPAVINRWKKKVRIWKRLASPYLPLPEMGLRLHDDGLTGRAAEIVHEEDDEDKDFCSEGCELVVKRV